MQMSDGKKALLPTASDAGPLGGTINPTPGEICIAHHGVLFLDELPEFKRGVLETIRQPLEKGRVTISRAAGTMTFPSPNSCSSPP
jgi:magnesium chelatase family protein